MNYIFLPRRRLLLLAGTGWLAGCELLPVMGDNTVAEAPAYRIGDRWVYSAREGFRVPVVWQETREVVSVTGASYTLRVTQKGPNVDNVRVEQWTAPGRLRVGAVFDEETRQFKNDLDALQFPLVPGKTWNQWVDNYNETAKKEGDINRYGNVRGWSSISTPAGTFNAVAVWINMRLDDEEFWRYRTHCTYRLWYAPAVKGYVKEEREAEYQEKGGPFGAGKIRSQHGLLELLSFTPGA